MVRTRDDPLCDKITLTEAEKRAWVEQHNRHRAGYRVRVSAYQDEQVRNPSMTLWCCNYSHTRFEEPGYAKSDDLSGRRDAFWRECFLVLAGNAGRARYKPTANANDADAMLAEAIKRGRV